MKQQSNSFKITIFVLLVGAFISGLLVFQHFNQLHDEGLFAMLCGGSTTTGCAAVNRSEFSSILGVPLAAIGVWFYLTIVMILSLASMAGDEAKRVAGRISFYLLSAGLGVDLVLFGVQAFFLTTFCSLCISTYAVTMGAIYLLRRERKAGTTESAEAYRKLSERRMLMAVWSTGAALLFVAVASGSLVIAYQDPLKLQEEFSATVMAEFMASPVQTFDLAQTPMEGAHDPKITIVVFSDFLCPWCRQVAQSFQQLLPKWNDRVAVYYKHYPLDAFCNPYVKTSTHPGACWAALGGICAQDQGRFWEFHDRIFTLPPKNPGSETILKIAREAGLDTTAMSVCMHTTDNQRKVKAAMAEAHEHNIDGTPRVFINGRKLPQLSYLTAVLAAEAKRLGLKPLEGLNE